MKCKAIKYVPAEFTADVAGITLLSKEEYLEAKNIVPRLNGWWWLRSPGDGGDNAAVIGIGGHLNDHGHYVDITDGSVRPALRLNPISSDLQIGDKIQAAGKKWTVIPGDLALCDDSIGMYCFREDWKAPDANVYEASDVKKYIEGWARENSLLPNAASGIDRFIDAWTEENGPLV